MNLLQIEHLTKRYPGFLLDDVSFSVKEGEIHGFIGRNGAGKSTTLKCLFNLVHPDSGNVSFFGLPFLENEQKIKQDVGFVAGGINYYPHAKLRAITDVTRRFYPQWDNAAYTQYCRRFALKESKTPAQLSAGMQVKYALALALSHHAKLLVLDEPTSGLDPVSRDELLDIFLALAEEGVSILFSTHITSDLEKTADSITYIRHGKLEASEPFPTFVGRYFVTALSAEQHSAISPALLLGCKRSKQGYTALVGAENAQQATAAGLALNAATLEDIMIHLEYAEEEAQQ